MYAVSTPIVGERFVSVWLAYVVLSPGMLNRLCETILIATLAACVILYAHVYPTCCSLLRC